MKYIYYTTDKEKIEIISKKPLSLKILQSLVGGYIEFVPLRNGNDLVVNEDGVSKDLPENPFFKQKDTLNDIAKFGIRGNAIEGKTDENGELVGI